MNKAEIRKELNARRMLLSKEQLAGLSRNLTDQFATLNFEGVQTAHIFLPIAEKNEPDTFMLIRWLKLHHPEIKIIVPRADFKTALMTHHPYQGEEDLQKNLLNILEPVTDETHLGVIDIVIVPLLAFDSRGYRVGYGKGFYDRFLEGINTRKIGLSLFEGVDIIDDIHANDIRLDQCITPAHIIYFIP